MATAIGAEYRGYRRAVPREEGGNQPDDQAGRHRQGAVGHSLARDIHWHVKRSSRKVIGSSDEFGYRAEEQPISIHDLHATILNLLGMDHKKLTYRYNGRDIRLTDVYGELIPQIVKA